ncbi:MAG: arsenate reductase ArsC [Gammaproteobacteria bacterium]|nr:MAG: arsenate reductase ArsC [Gammaproteobacteria bacterium]
MSERPTRVLVLCTGNSCRSIMAEALINTLGQGRFRAVSAGSRPTGQVHPGALATLQRHGIDPGEPTSQSWDDYADEAFDYVITVCDSAAEETCPAFPGRFERIHWSIPDPAHVEGSAAEIEAAFERAFALLRSRIETELLTAAR